MCKITSHPADTSSPFTSTMASTVSPSSLRSRENDNTHHQPPDGDSHHGSVRPLHRRALETMPHDVHIPLPLSSIQYSKDEPNRMLNADGTTSLYLQDSNSNPLEKPHCRYGNDREEGYGDNNNSTQLSDVDTAFPTLHQAEQGDTIEDVMNIPGTKIVPAPVQDFNAFYPRDEPTPDETRQLRRRRGVIEAEIREQLLEQVDAHAITAAEGFTKEFTPQDDARDTKTEFDTADAVGAFQEVQPLVLEETQTTLLTLYSLLSHSTAAPPRQSHTTCAEPRSRLSQESHAHQPSNRFPTPHSTSPQTYPQTNPAHHCVGTTRLHHHRHRCPCAANPPNQQTKPKTQTQHTRRNYMNSRNTETWISRPSSPSCSATTLQAT